MKKMLHPWWMMILFLPLSVGWYVPDRMVSGGDELSSELAALKRFHQGMKEASYDLSYRIYGDSSGRSLSQQERGRYLQWGGYSLSNFMDRKIIIRRPDRYLVVDKVAKLVLMDKPGGKTPVEDPIKPKDFAQMIEQMQQYGQIKVSLHEGSESSRYIRVQMTSGSLYRMEYHYHKTGYYPLRLRMQVRKNNTSSKPSKPEDFQLVEVLYQNFKPSVTCTASDFDFTSYVRLNSNKTYSLNPDYQHYQFINHLR